MRVGKRPRAVRATSAPRSSAANGGQSATYGRLGDAAALYDAGLGPNPGGRATANPGTDVNMLFGATIRIPC
jgi:hypothetical protein